LLLLLLLLLLLRLFAVGLAWYMLPATCLCIVTKMMNGGKTENNITETFSLITHHSDDHDHDQTSSFRFRFQFSSFFLNSVVGPASWSREQEIRLW